MELRATIPCEAREWRNHPAVWKWCRQYSPLSEAHHKRWLERIETDPTVKMFGIFAASRYVGVCGLTAIDKHNQTAEFSLYIAPEQQRKGYGSSALRLLIHHGFSNMNLNRIWGETFEGNPALQIFLSLGFKTEGTLRETYFREGRFIDSTIVSMLRTEYQC